MTQLRNKLTAALKKIHNQEEGMEALQTVLIMALAALVLVAAYKMMAGQDGNGGVIADIGSKVGAAVATWGAGKLGIGG